MSGRSATGLEAKSSSWPSVSQSKVLSSAVPDKLKDKNLIPSYLWTEAANKLGVEINLLKAFAAQESIGRGFSLEVDTETGQRVYIPIILFERHWFYRLTKDSKTNLSPHRGKKVPGILAPKNLICEPAMGGYGKFSDQHKKLQYAVTLNRDAALQSCSWGMFQILGVNYKRAGYEDVQSFINAMYRSIGDHFDAFVNFCLWDDKLIQAMKDKDFYLIAERYNGKARRIKYGGEIKNKYFKLEGVGTV